MSIGALLLQPQVLDQHSRLTHATSLGDQLFTLVQTLASNDSFREYFLLQVTEACSDLINELETLLETNRDAGLASVEQIVQPFIDSIEQLIPDDTNIETVGDVLDLVLDFAEILAGFIESINLDSLRALLDNLFDGLLDAMGISIEYLQQTFMRAIDQVIDHLETIDEQAPEGYAEFQLQLIQVLKRLRRELLAQAQLPTIDTEPLARQLLAQLEFFGLDTIQEKIGCWVEKVRALVDAGTSIYEFATSLDDSVGAAHAVPEIEQDGTYLWYASWLYKSRRRSNVWQYFGTYLFPMVPGDEVWHSEDRKTLILRTGIVRTDDEILHCSDEPFDWCEAPQFANTSGADEHFTFTPALSAHFLEEWAKATGIVVYMAKMTGHVIHASEPGNHISHSILSAWNLTRFIGSAVTQTPFVSWWRQRWNMRVANRSWMEMFFQWGTIFGGSFEGFHGDEANDRFQLWLTLIGDDAHDSFLIHLWPTMVYEGFLSIFTLINYKGSGYTDFFDDGKARNFQYTYPLTNVWLVFYSWLQSRVARERIEYSHPFESTHMRPFLLNQLLYAPLFGALAGITGELFGWAFSRQVSPRNMLVQLGWGAYKSFGMYMVTSYFWHEGDTDGGKYNAGYDASGNLIAWPDFGGYGDPDTSPYRLPVAAGSAIFVGQAHQGMFSHFNDGGGTIQIYASDFAHDFQELVVAIRDGTVVDFDDTQIDSNTNNWNYITIQHNDPFNRETAEMLDHDLDEGGAATTTYAVYGHGAQDGVEAVFTDKGIARANIIGTQVRRGEPVMQAGDTGVSFHNHLHLHLRPGPTPLPPGDPGLPQTVSDATLDAFAQRTLPIVFNDATHPLKPNGRLYHLTWYRSNNTLWED